MKLRAEVEREHSKQQCLKIASYVGVSPARFAELVNIFLSGPYRITQRAAWPLSVCVERNPDLIKPHLSSLLDFVVKEGVHDAAKRNIMRLLQFVDIPKRHHGKLLDICFRFLTDTKEPIAVQVFAMTVLHSIIVPYPELQHELKVILENHLPYASAGYRSRAMRILRALQAIPVKV